MRASWVIRQSFFVPQAFKLDPPGVSPGVAHPGGVAAPTLLHLKSKLVDSLIHRFRSIVRVALIITFYSLFMPTDELVQGLNPGC